MKTVIAALLSAALGLVSGCVAVPTRHGLVLAPVAPVIGVGVGYGYGPYPHYYR